MAKKPKAQFFTTVTDMRAIPTAKIDHFCEDLRLWLHMHKIVEAAKADVGVFGVNLRIATPEDQFGWVDDGKHDANINITFREESAPTPTVDAVGEAPE